MSHIHKGQLTASSEWWKHLDYMKNPFWKRERKTERVVIEAELIEYDLTKEVDDELVQEERDS